ncbi:hypothetical protein [Streptomyces sp. AC550_RSS872]|uniref:hypothetical protein n=1 Tax=Streptomyces sp. AC550_RSS872 TaxID=2823689 RepID=UPI001C275008|nr:hypothetical protein [Streptomyces sp. AC550_RSS872]
MRTVGRAAQDATDKGSREIINERPLLEAASVGPGPGSGGPIWKDSVVERTAASKVTGLERMPGRLGGDPDPAVSLQRPQGR